MELEYGSDALVKDRQAQEVIAAKAMLSRLVSAVEAPVAVKEIVTIRRFKDVSDFIHQAGIDLWWSGTKIACSVSIPLIPWSL